MSLSRHIFSPLEDQNFAMCITPQDFILPFYNIQRGNYYRLWNWCTQNMIRDVGSTIVEDKESFRIILDVEHFHVNEIDVKVTKSEIIITGEHEERQDKHGLIARKFTRRYILPRDCPSDNVTCTLSSDGILIVHVVKKPLEDIKDKEKTVPIKIDSTYKETEIIHQIDSRTATDIDQSSIVKEIEENLNKEKQVMLKEDDYCFLKPQLLEDACSAFKAVSDTIEKSRSEFETDVDELVNAQSEILEQAKKVVSEFLEESLGSSSVTEQLVLNYNQLQQSQPHTLATSETLNATTTLSEMSNTCTAASSVSQLANTTMAVAASPEVMATEINELSASNIAEELFVNTKKEVEEFPTERSENCEQAISAEQFEESLEQFNAAMSTLSLSEHTEQSNTSTMEQSQQISALKMEESEQISSSKIEQSEQFNVSATTSEVSTSNATAMQESLYVASASVKAATEELNDFITDVIAELREATENL